MTHQELAVGVLAALDGCLGCVPPAEAERLIVAAIEAAVAAERDRWESRVRLAFEVIDRYVPLGLIPDELDDARRESAIPREAGRAS